MTSLPTPFVVAFLIGLLVVINHPRLKQTPTGQVLEWVLILFIVSMVFIGLRWALDQVMFLPVAAVLSVAGSALLYLAYCSLGRHGPVVLPRRDWPHALPIVLLVLCLALNPRWVEFALILIKLVYVVLLIILARQAPHSLQMVRLGWLENSQQSLWGTAILLLVSTVIDIAIVIDFALYEGRHASYLVGTINLLIILGLGWITVKAGQGRAVDQPMESRLARAEALQEKMQETDAQADEGVLKQLNDLLLNERLYADTELNLQKLARKSGIPTRTLSRVINVQTGLNMSQWVNQARVHAVCELLKNPDMSVNEAMMEAGFVTKSNFNREFKRVTGMSPSQWRATQLAAS